MATYYEQVVDRRTGHVYLVRHNDSSTIDGGKIVLAILSFIGAAIVGPVVTVLAQSYLNNPKVTQLASVPSHQSLPTDQCAGALEDWKRAAATNTRASYREYLSNYPNCPFSDLARSHIALIDENDQIKIEDERARSERQLKQEQADSSAQLQRLQIEMARERAAAEAEARRLQEQSLPQEQTSTTRGWIGITIESISPQIAANLGLSNPTGAIVIAVQPSSPAALAGIETGDIIWAINGRAVTSANDLAARVSNTVPGATVILGIIRDGSNVMLSIAPRQTATLSEDTSAPQLGVTVAPSDDSLETGSPGVRITSVQPGSLAASYRLKVGDVMLEVNGTPVATETDVRNALINARNEGRHAVLLKIKSGGLTMFVAIRFVTPSSPS
jgi:C-terminal processing protease CtpA/Prc